MNYSIRYFQYVMSGILAVGIFADIFLAAIYTGHLSRNHGWETRLEYFIGALIVPALFAVLSGRSSNAHTFYFSEHAPKNNPGAMILGVVLFSGIAAAVIFLEKKTIVGTFTGLSVLAVIVAMAFSMLTLKRRVEIGPNYVVIIDKAIVIIDRYKIQGISVAGYQLIIRKPIREATIDLIRFDRPTGELLFSTLQDWCYQNRIPFQ